MSEFLWVEKYRPKTIAETILPKELKTVFEKVISSGELPNMLFTGTAGTGKTTVAKALCNQLNLDYILINGSEESEQCLKASVLGAIYNSCRDLPAVRLRELLQWLV